MTLSALNDDGKPVDWWFLYKLPQDARPTTGTATTTGFEYLYYEPGQAAPSRSAHTLADGGGALHQTLAGFFGSAVGGPPAADVPITTGWILYNDEIPGATVNDERRGHTKGVLAFDAVENSALWLLHSTPRFPHPRDVRFPDDERIYGQTMVCITLTGIEAAEQIAAQMLDEQEPQTYGCFVPDGIGAQSPLRELAGMPRVSEATQPSDISFKSLAGADFTSIAKSHAWNDDFWNDLVGPKLGVDLDVETWRRGALASTEDSDHVHTSTDVLAIDLSSLGVPFGWNYTRDHAKWAISTTPDWVCVGDINRQVSQRKRGGGTISMQDSDLWKALDGIQREGAPAPSTT
jgi:deoxyribonuclease II